MLKIRLQRKGKRNQPFFRIVVTEKKNSPRGGRALEMLGFLNPLTKEKQIKADRIKHWLSVGAQPSDRVHNLLVTEGIIKDKKRPVHAKPKKREEDEKPAAEAAAAKKQSEAAPAEDKKEEAKPEEPVPSEAEVKKEEEKPAKEEKPVEEEPKQEPKPEKPAEKPAEKKEEKTEDKKE